MRDELYLLRESPGCESCVHFNRTKPDDAWRDGYVEFCAHPVYCEVKKDLRTGSVVLAPYRTPIDLARGETGACGPDALLYEKQSFVSLRRSTRWLREFWRLNWEALIYALLVTSFCVVVMRRVGLVVGPLMALVFLFMMIKKPKRE